MITLQLCEPHELRPVLCGARRRPGGWLTCTAPALHRCGEHPASLGFHSARDKAGRWHFWIAA